jgi:hypothetical protein
MAPPSRDVIARASAPRRVSRRSRARVVVCDVAPPPVAGRVRSIDRSIARVARRTSTRRCDASIDRRARVRSARGVVDRTIDRATPRVEPRRVDATHRSIDARGFDRHRRRFCDHVSFHRARHECRLAAIFPNNALHSGV